MEEATVFLQVTAVTQSDKSMDLRTCTEELSYTAGMVLVRIRARALGCLSMGHSLRRSRPEGVHGYQVLVRLL